jgi:hypothetical protein
MKFPIRLNCEKKSAGGVLSTGKSRQPPPLAIMMDVMQKRIVLALVVLICSTLGAHAATSRQLAEIGARAWSKYICAALAYEGGEEDQFSRILAEANKDAVSFITSYRDGQIRDIDLIATVHPALWHDLGDELPLIEVVEIAGSARREAIRMYVSNRLQVAEDTKRAFERGNCRML